MWPNLIWFQYFPTGSSQSQQVPLCYVSHLSQRASTALGFFLFQRKVIALSVALERSSTLDQRRATTALPFPGTNLTVKLMGVAVFISISVIYFPTRYIQFLVYLVIFIITHHIFYHATYCLTVCLVVLEYNSPFQTSFAPHYVHLSLKSLVNATSLLTYSVLLVVTLPLCYF